MRAAFYDTQGAANDVLQIGEVSTPTPRAGEVLVRIHASGCNPSDVKLRAGARPMGFDRIIPHSDGAGVIEAVGDGVDPSRIGARVWLWNGQWQRAFGTCAEYIALPSEQAVDLPDTVGFSEGACLGIPASTAARCLFADGPIDGQTVLITGGAGTVGRYAIAMAKMSGAQVVTTVSGPEKAAYATAAGADHVVNYREGNTAEQILDMAGPVDRIVEVEFGQNVNVSTEVIKPGGVIAAYGSAGNMTPELPFYPLMFKDVTLRMVLVYLLSAQARAQVVAAVNDLCSQGLSHSVAEEYPLDQAVAAHQAVEAANKMGSVVVTV